ncbi:MAG: hemin uptake protein HemP [Thiohalophilus sp.]
MSEKRSSNPDNRTRNTAEPGAHLISSDALLPEGRPLHIEHRGEIYMLRRTRSGKLILTK